MFSELRELGYMSLSSARDRFACLVGVSRTTRLRLSVEAGTYRVGKRSRWHPPRGRGAHRFAPGRRVPYRFPVRAIRRFTVRPVMPESLRPLEELAINLRWCWHPETQDLFEAVDADAWAASH